MDDGKIIIRGTRKNPQYISKLDPLMENERFFFAAFPGDVVRGVLPLDLVENLSVVISGCDKDLMDKLWQEAGTAAITLDDLKSAGIPLEQCGGQYGPKAGFIRDTITKGGFSKTA